MPIALATVLVEIDSETRHFRALVHHARGARQLAGGAIEPSIGCRSDIGSGR